MNKADRCAKVLTVLTLMVFGACAGMLAMRWWSADAPVPSTKPAFVAGQTVMYRGGETKPFGRLDDVGVVVSVDGYHEAPNGPAWRYRVRMPDWHCYAMFGQGADRMWTFWQHEIMAYPQGDPQ